MLLHNWIQLGLIALTIIVGFIVHIRYKKKVEKLDGWVGFAEEYGHHERIEGHDWQMELFKEMEQEQRKSLRKQHKK